MDTTIFFYTGTGNSLWTARKLAEKSGIAELIPLALTGHGPIRTDTQRIGIAFPVHIWGLPQPVIDFVRRLENDSKKYYFALAVNAGQVAASLLQLNRLLAEKGLPLHGGFSIYLPSNYIPWGGAIAEEKQQKLFKNTLDKINVIAETILACVTKPPEHGPRWQNIFLSALYHLSFSRVAGMDKSFWSDEKCTGCGICKKICPAGNIILSSKKPVWQHRCDQCFACLQWCPEEAIQYGKTTRAKKRYHHPEISLCDMLACVPYRD
jgi:ferredoxin